MYTYVAVFSFLHPGCCTYMYMLHARLYYDTCAPLHRPVCTYTFATRMTTLRTLRTGGSRLSGNSLPTKMYLVGPSSQGANHFVFFCPDALPCVRRCSWWVPAVRGKRFFMKYGGSSGGSLLSGGGKNILRVIRRHFLAAAVDPAISFSIYSTPLMEVIR